MANYLGMAQVHAIQTLRACGWSFRRIGRELGVHRDTVARYVRLAEAGPAADGGSPGDAQNRPNLPTGLDGQNRPNPPTGSGPAGPGYESGPASLCEPFRAAIIGGFDRGLSYQRIWQDLKTEHGFAGGYDSVKRFARRLKRASPLPFHRMECDPGEEAQIDFGTGAPVVTPDGRRRKTHVLRVVPSHSRRLTFPPQTDPGFGLGFRPGSWSKGNEQEAIQGGRDREQASRGGCDDLSGQEHTTGRKADRRVLYPEAWTLSPAARSRRTTFSRTPPR